MARIIPLPLDRHAEAQALLPWFVTGQLDPAELGRVEAHIAGCGECQAALARERAFREAYAALPLETEHGWAEFQRRVKARSSLGSRLVGLGRKLRLGPVGLGWALAVPAVLAAIGLAVLLAPSEPVGPYRALGRPPVAGAVSGNVIVIFRPETPERDLRRALLDSDARLVDGPTEADAYVLRVPADRRDAALARLRARPDVVMAEPVDSGGPP